MKVLDLTAYRETREIREYNAWAEVIFADLDKANRAAEEAIALMEDYKKKRAKRTIWDSWWGPWPPKGAA